MGTNEKVKLVEPVWVEFEIRDKKRNLTIFCKGSFGEFEACTEQKPDLGDDHIINPNPIHSECRLIAEKVEIRYIMDADMKKNDDICAQDLTKLAGFIIANFPDKIKDFEGAADTAIRILREYGGKDNRVYVK